MLHHVVREFTSPRLIGVDAGSALIKAVELSQHRGRITVERWGIAEANDSGLAAALQPMLNVHDGKTPRVIIGLASPELVVKAVNFPRMPKKELQSAIRLEAEQAILNGHALEEMAIDWHPLISESADGLRGLLAVAPKTIVATKIRTFAAAGLRPLIVDVEGLALWNAYWSLLGHREAGRKTILLVHVGAQKTNLVIVTGRDQLVLIRDLQVGLAAIKSGRGVEWTEEVRDSLAYARAQGGLRSLDAAFITGGGDGPMLLSLVKAVIPSPAIFWNPLDRLERGADCPPIERGVGPLLSIAIGLALRHG